MNKFSRLRDFVNTFKDGDVITREMMSISLEFNRAEESTYDLYRVRLCRMGYLDHTARGEYTKVKDLPEDMRVKDTLVCYLNQRIKLKR